MELLNKYKTLFTKYGITTILRKAMFLAQADHESGLKPVSEGFYYRTVESLRNTFYSPFKGKSDAFIAQYVKNPEKCANYVYANRMGNGNEASGDGWKYRGRGIFQVTGKDNYAKLSKDTGVDYVSNPDLLLTEADSLIAALWFWNINNLNKYADTGNIDAVSDIINKGRLTSAYGDAHGFSFRNNKYQYYKNNLK